MKSSDMSHVLETAYEARHEIVPCFISKPGIGKTSAIEDFARSKGVNLVTFILSNTIPSEVSGIRMPDTETKRLEVFDDARMRSLKDGDILFFDEVLEAPRELWSACLTLIQSRQMASGRQLPDVMIVAASNPVASPAMIPASVRDRFMFFDVEFDYDAWKKWFRLRFKAEPCITESDLFDDVGYNLMTPRTFTKLYTWYDSAADNDGRDFLRQVIKEMYGIDVMKNIILTYDRAHGKKSGKEQILDALVDSGFDFENCTDYWLCGLPDHIDKMSLPSFLTHLQGSEYWDEIKDIIEKVEFDGDDFPRTDADGAVEYPPF